jgi:uncharacterized MAPEG superfamily protein
MTRREPAQPRPLQAINGNRIQDQLEFEDEHARETTMTRELLWLTLTVILTGALWIPYIVDRIVVRGLMGAMANPSRDDKPQSPWAQRLYFAHTNAVDNLVVFAPLVLILDSMGHSTQSTVIACAVYFWARLAHAIVYAFGIPVLRTLAFAVGVMAQVMLVLAVFGKL